jgi:hypothetical protein
MTAAAVLALMLVLGQPGYSTQSAVPLEHDGDHTCAQASDEGCRKETRDEGMRRWYVIAQAIADVSNVKDGVSDGALARALIVTTRAESAWWRGVHIGIIRGDNGYARCLVQRNWQTLDDGADVPESKPGEHWRARDLDGIGYAETRRCIEVGARVLRRCMRSCSYSPACWWSRYGGSVAHSDPRIVDRVRMYEAIEMRTLHLTADTMEALAL